MTSPEPGLARYRRLSLLHLRWPSLSRGLSIQTRGDQSCYLVGLSRYMDFPQSNLKENKFRTTKVCKSLDQFACTSLQALIAGPRRRKTQRKRITWRPAVYPPSPSELGPGPVLWRWPFRCSQTRIIVEFIFQKIPHGETQTMNPPGDR